MSRPMRRFYEDEDDDVYEVKFNWQNSNDAQLMTYIGNYMDDYEDEGWFKKVIDAIFDEEANDFRSATVELTDDEILEMKSAFDDKIDHLLDTFGRYVKYGYVDNLEDYSDSFEILAYAKNKLRQYA